MLDDVIINVILILFPLLIYFVISCYSEVNNKKTKNYVFNLLNCTSIYLCIKYGKTENLTLLLLFCDISVMIAYIKRKDKLSVILSLALLIYCYYTHEIGVYMFIIIAKYISFFIVYQIHKRKEKDKLITVSAIFQAFYTSMLYFINPNNKVYDIIDIFWIICIFFITSILVLYLFKILDNLSNLFISIKELEKDKQTKNSLFKLTHEIKNPLAVCKGYLEMINIDNKEKTNKYIGIIKQEIERSLLIMADFRCLNKITLQKEQVDLNLLVAEVYESLKLLVKSKNIKLIFNNPEELYINLDFSKIKQVLINIIKNSVEAIENTGMIEIKTYKKYNYVYIEVKDNGIGMSDEVKERLTELFFTTKKNGTGLGVALSNEIVNAHNGEIKYDSKLNIGTTVIIKLPVN